jgi:predicted Holliday junction resolvase-like endonuclease
MNVGDWIALVASICAVITVIIMLVQLRNERRQRSAEKANELAARSKEEETRKIEDAVRNSETERRLEQMEHDITRAYGRLGAAQESAQQTAVLLGKIEERIKAVSDSTTRIEENLREHIRNCGPDRAGG